MESLAAAAERSGGQAGEQSFVSSALGTLPGMNHFEMLKTAFGGNAEVQTNASASSCRLGQGNINVHTSERK